MQQRTLFSRLGLLALLICLIPLGAIAQSDGCIGYWKTIDDETNKARSIVQIYKSGDKYFGKVIKLFREPGEEPNPVCDECDDDDPRYKKPVIGMVVMTDLEWDADDDEWDDGEILDPENGEVYDCYIALESQDKLKVRGFLGLSVLGRTQYWYRAENPN